MVPIIEAPLGPNGTKIAWSEHDLDPENGNDEIYVMDADGSNRKGPQSLVVCYTFDINSTRSLGCESR